MARQCVQFIRGSRSQLELGLLDGLALYLLYLSLHLRLRPHHLRLLLPFEPPSDLRRASLLFCFFIRFFCEGEKNQTKTTYIHIVIAESRKYPVQSKSLKTPNRAKPERRKSAHPFIRMVFMFFFSLLLFCAVINAISISSC